MPEPIAIDVFPCWQQQSSEPEDKFLLFQGFFLPLPRPNLTEAYRRYQADMGRDGQVNNVPTAWRDDCERYQWRERHTAYWLDRHQQDLDWIAGQRRELASRELDLGMDMIAKASEILATLPIDPRATSFKDVSALARAGSELARLSLSWDNLDKAFDCLNRAGFAISIKPEHKKIYEKDKILATLESGGNNSTGSPNAQSLGGG